MPTTLEQADLDRIRKLVSAEEAQKGYDRSLHHQKRLYETIKALWPVVKWAATRPCKMMDKEDCGECGPCLARKLLKED